MQKLALKKVFQANEQCRDIKLVLMDRFVSEPN